MNRSKGLFVHGWVTIVLGLAVICCHTAQAQTGGIAPQPQNPLETAPTHWDQTGTSRSEGNAVLDTRDGRVQSVSQLFEGPYSGQPEDAARAFLAAHKDWVGANLSDKDLRAVRSVESPGGYHVTFERFVGNVPVYPGNLVVSFDRDMYARFYFSSLYLFTDNVPTAGALSSADAERLAIAYLQPVGDPFFGPQSDLVVWAGDNRDFAACWRVRVNYEEPRGDWEILIDANSGQVRRVKDRAQAVNGTGYVFDPDPITTSGQPYGSPGLTDNNDANSPQLTAQRFSRTLLDINDFYFLGNHFYTLTGPYCTIQNIQNPAISPVMQTNNTVFDYTRDADAFEDVVVYYHLDKSQRYIQSLGFNNIQNLSIAADPHAENFSCNAHYHPDANNLTFGQGRFWNGSQWDSSLDADAAEDAEVVLHEYGHAINNSISPGFGGGDEDATGEGWGDYWGGSYGRSVSSYQATWIGSWALHNCFGGRSLQANLHYPEDAGQEVHYSGQIWSQALYDAEVNVNSRTIMNRIALQSYYYYGNGSSMLTSANAVITADQNLYGGSHQTGITTSFIARGLITPPNNDQCPGFTIYDQPYTSNGTTANAAHNYPNCQGNNSQDVVYTIASKPCPRNIVISLCGSGYDTGLSVYTGGSCPGTTQVACNDDYCNLQSQISFTAAANTVYYVLVHGYATYSGSYSIAVTWSDSDPIPPNDACSGALAITALPYSHTSTTCGASDNYLNCIGPSSPETVYSLTLGTCQTVTVSLCGSGFDTALEVRWGGGCPGSQTVACNDDACGLASQLTFNATANETYYIFVDGYCTTCKGPYVLNVTSNGAYVAPNDQCPGTVIAALPYQDTGSTRCASNNFSNCIGTGSNDVVYQYTSPICQNVTVSLCGSGYDTAIEVRSGGACPGLARVACNDDDCGLQSQMSYFAESGVDYYFIVHGYSLYAGPYVLNVTGVAGGVRPNDQCAGANAISTLPYLSVGSTTCANNDNTNCVGSTSRDVFYSLQLESCYEATISLCGSGYDTALELRSGGFSCPGTLSIACNDDYCGLQSEIHQTILSNRPYWIIVHGYSTYSGPFILNVTGATCPPESLVVQRQSNNIYLDWAPTGSTGSVTYRIYRSITSDVQIIPQNLLATTTNAFYSDLNAVSDPQTRYFYAVTAEGPALLHESSPEKAATLAEPEKKNYAGDEAAERTGTIPTYIDPAAIQGPNPNKPEAVEAGANENGSWYGTPAPLPADRQIKH